MSKQLNVLLTFFTQVFWSSHFAVKFYSSSEVERRYLSFKALITDEYILINRKYSYNYNNLFVSINTIDLNLTF